MKTTQNNNTLSHRLVFGTERPKTSSISLFNDLDQLFFDSNIFKDVFMTNNNSSRTPTNVHEDENNIHIEISMPGVNKENIQVFVENNTLNIKAISTKSSENSENKNERKVLRREFFNEEVSKQFELPDHINCDTINSTYENGILNIVLPKLNVQESNNNKKSILVK